MRKLFIVLTIFSICQVVKAADTNNLDPNLYLQKIKQLEKTIESQQKIIGRLNLKLDEQTKENKRLKNLLSQASIDISPQKDKELLKRKSENVINMSLEQLCQFVKGPLTTLQQKE